MSGHAHGLRVVQVRGREDEAAGFLPSGGRTSEDCQLFSGQLSTCRFVVLAVSIVDDVVIKDRETKRRGVVLGLQEEIETLSEVGQGVVVAVRFAVVELEVLSRRTGIGKIALVEGFVPANFQGSASGVAFAHGSLSLFADAGARARFIRLRMPSTV